LVAGGEGEFLCPSHLCSELELTGGQFGELIIGPEPCRRSVERLRLTAPFEPANTWSWRGE
jgi:hypothetical protein